MANEVLYNATRGISDLILMPGLINLDFADVRTTMLDGGAAIMGAATAEGPDRAEIAAREAINSPLLDGVSIRGARNVLVNISAGSSLGMRETTTATSIIQDEAGENAEIIMGTVLDESYEDELRVTVIATGFEIGEDQNKAKLSPSNRATALGSSDNENKIKTPSADSIPRRIHRNTPEFYKGEKNLKNLDSPAIHRRGLNIRSIREQQEEQQEQTGDQSQQGGGFGLNHNEQRSTNQSQGGDRKERIDKSNSDQPAFLRKIMD